ncbi:MAG: DUF1330 domain-containing protein [Caulobacterales bacterium]
MRRVLAALFVASALGCATQAPPQVAAIAPVEVPPNCIMLVTGTVTDRASFRQYAAALPPLYERFGGSYLAIARNPEVLEGQIAYESLVVSRWPTCDAARAFWNSPDYRALAQMRQAWASFDVIIAPMQPANTTVAPIARTPN